MVKPTIEEIRASDLTPLEQELALASFGAEALSAEPHEAGHTPHARPASRDPRHGHTAATFAAASDSAPVASASAAYTPIPRSPITRI